MDSMKYKDFNRVPPKPPRPPKTHEYCPKVPEPPQPDGKFCRTKLKKHPAAEPIKYKMKRMCPQLDYRAELCQPIVICDTKDEDDCKPKPRIRKRVDLDDDDSWLKPIPKPPKCPDPITNPCKDDVDEQNLPPCKFVVPEYNCGNY